jgi:YD repeat-containing protein
VNIKFRRDLNFWNRKKGLVVSAWMYVPGSSASNPNPVGVIELRPSASTAPISVINVLAEYQSAHGNAFPFNRWFKLERVVTWDELNTISFTDTDPNSQPLLRIWFGKVAPAGNSLPVYVDDLRVHPADAAMSSRTYDAAGRVTSNSDGVNQPVYIRYDAWGEPMGRTDDRGLSFTAEAAKRVED